MKLWEKGISTNKMIEKFTVGNDRQLDLLLAKFDVYGNIAHAQMLSSIGILTQEEFLSLKKELVEILQNIQNANFKIDDDIEDIHSQIELILTNKLGEAGKKIHTARSRNDQVLVDIKLFIRENIFGLTENISQVFNLLISKSEEFKNVLMPGYTHFQIAMPSSFGLWFGAFAESLADDLQTVLASYKINNQNPLGSAAGYGSSFPIDRKMTTELLGFDDLNYNSVYAQMSRAKNDRALAFAIASVASTIGKMANDLCVFMSQNFNFFFLPDEFTTGSSIMPHKKNPDVFELLRAKCNRLQNLPYEITLISTNLISGYFRDYQILKDIIFPAFYEINNCLDIYILMLQNVEINKTILNDARYDYLFSVEKVNQQVLQGIPFRTAYKNIAEEIKNGNFKPNKTINHTHEGSIGNLCNKEITEKFERIIDEFNFTKYQTKIAELIKL